MNKIYFYLPESRTISMPVSIEQFWEWQCSADGISSLWGRYHWTLQTYLHLRSAGLPVRLVAEFPNDGVVLAHRDDLSSNHKPNKNLFIVCMLVDRDEPHPQANVHILHNPVAKIRFGSTTYYMPPWPQVSLRKRRTTRGNTFKRVGFFGSLENMAEKNNLDRFRDSLGAHGLELVIPKPENWNDFSEIDFIYGIRSYGLADPAIHKPALKLINAWIAEVPAVFGYESAYRAEGAPGVNYLEATNREQLDGIFAALSKDASLRRSVVQAGTVAAKNFSVDRVRARWISLLEGKIVPAFQIWRSSRFTRDQHRFQVKLRTGLLRRFHVLHS